MDRDCFQILFLNIEGDPGIYNLKSQNQERGKRHFRYSPESVSYAAFFIFLDQDNFISFSQRQKLYASEVSYRAFFLHCPEFIGL